MAAEAKVVTVGKILNKTFSLPGYQRPYKWTTRNVNELLDDISRAAEESEKSSDYRYRVGTIIVHKNKGNLDIVDGQQRLITLSLMARALNPGFENSLLIHKYDDAESQKHIQENWRVIREWRGSIDERNSESDRKPVSERIFEDLLEIVLIEVDSLPEAFQLFDSQNIRGKRLDPTDLLKAYHLREMSDCEEFEKRRTVERWEAIDPEDISKLFSLYLFPILNWSRREKTHRFGIRDIDAYKGVTNAYDSYTYAKRTHGSMPYYQIDQPFCAGTDFFHMVEHYEHLLKDLEGFIEKVDENSDLGKVRAIIAENTRKDSHDRYVFRSTGLRYAVNLFMCALLFYFDRFHSLDDRAVKKLFAWAMMVRIDRRSLGFNSINKYAIGYEGFTNEIAMFYRIAIARNKEEIGSIRIELPGSDGTSPVKDEKNWKQLYQAVRQLLGEK